MRRLAVISLASALACSGCAAGIVGSPNSISKTGAVVPGKVVSTTGGQVEYWLRFGTTMAYGKETPHATVNAAQGTLVSVTPSLSGLQPATTYHYRLCATDSQQQGGPGCSEDRSFKTQTVGCGDTVTADVKLTGDLDCSVQVGLVVGADGIDINLGGHAILGGIFVGGGGATAIDNSAGFDDLTVRNGKLVAVGVGIDIEGGERNRILDISVGSAGNSIVIGGGADNEIRRSSAFARASGIEVADSQRMVIADTEARGFFGFGIRVSGDGARILRNRSHYDGPPVSLASGIRLTGAGGRIADNEVTGQWDTGGIAVYGPDNAVVGNEVTGAALPPGGIVSDALGDGIFLGPGSGGSLVRGNRGDSNEGDGIDVRASGVRIEGNAASSNGDFGIDAAAGVIDLGGNTAGSNGNPLQCRNVFCP